MATNGSNTREIVIDFRIMNGDAVKTIQDTKTKIDNLKSVLKGMKDQGLENSEMYHKLSAALKDNQQVMKANQKILLDNIRQQKSNQDSLNAMRAKLRELKTEYENLSKTERESAIGSNLLQNIKNTTDEVSNLEHELGDWTRQVGHYQEALNGLPGGKVILMFKSLSNGTLSLSTAFKNGTLAVKNFGKQLLTLLKNPWVALFTAIASAVMKLVDSFKKNDQAMTELSRTFAAFKPIIDIIEKAFQSLVGVVTKVIGAIGNGVRKLMSWIPGLRDYVQAEDDIVAATDRLEDSEREYTVNSAKRQAEISDLRNKSVQSDKYSFKERKKFLEQALQLEQDELKDKQDIANEKLRIAREEAATEIGYAEYSQEAYDKMSDEAKNKLAELEAAVINASTEFSDGTRRMQSSLSSFTKQEESEQKQRAAAAASARKERLKNEREAVAALNKMWIDGIRNLQDKEYALTVEENRKQIAALKERLQTEKNLTETAREAINRQIILLEADLQLKLGDLRKKYEQEEYDRQLETAKNYYSHLLAGLSDESVDAKVAVQLEINKIDTEELKKGADRALESVRQVLESAQRDFEELDYNELAEKYSDVWDRRGIETGDNIAKMRELVRQYNEEFVRAETERNNLVMAIDKEHLREEERIRNEGLKKLHDNQEKRVDLTRKHAEILRQIELAGMYSPYETVETEKTRIMLEQARERVRIAQEEYARLLEEREKYNDEELKAIYGSVDEYNNAVLEANLNVVESENAVKDAVKAVTDESVKQKSVMVNTATSIMGSLNSILGSFQGLFETMAESDEKYADYATGLAMMQILVSTAISIANAIQGATAAAAATGPGAPIATPIFIAEMIGIVVGAITSATATLLKAKQSKESPPKFSSGGPVKGSGTGTSDSIPAMLSNGEYVIREKIVREYGEDFFDKINFGGVKPIIDGIHFAQGGLVQTLSVPNVNVSDMIDYDAMRDVMVDAMSEIQPVVSVKEITKAQNRVRVKESIARN